MMMNVEMKEHVMTSVAQILVLTHAAKGLNAEHETMEQYALAQVYVFNIAYQKATYQMQLYLSEPLMFYDFSKSFLQGFIGDPATACRANRNSGSNRNSGFNQRRNTNVIGASRYKRFIEDILPTLYQA